MAHYTASDARRQFFALLDAAERGEEIVIGRRDTHFRLVLEPPTTEIPTSPFLIEDEDVLSGNWTWTTDEEGQLQFKARDR